MANNSEISRREFLKSSAKTGAGIAAISGMGLVGTTQRILGANDKVRVAICGVRGRGYDHIKGYAKVPQAQIVAICDVDENVGRERIGDMEKMGLAKPAYYYDVRKLLEDKSIDAVSIATPDHWHSLIAIWACQAGKDVYVEKPCCHNWWEGKQLVTAANRYNRIVQHGTQSRSSTGIVEGMQKLRDGLIGEVYMSRGLCYKWRPTIGHTPNEAAAPAGVHYDLWLGPAPIEPFTRNHFHYNWHYFWNYGSGDLGNQGIHQLDIARWGLGVKFPNRASAIGGKFLFADDQLTPNVINCAFQFDQPDGTRKMLEFEVRGWMTNHEAAIGLGKNANAGLPPAGLGARQKLGPTGGAPATIGDIFYGSKGYMVIDGEGYKTFMGESQEPGPTGRGEGDHFQNFIDVVRSRNKQDLHAPIEEGYISSTLIYLANASYRLGRTIEFDPDALEVVNDDQANRLLRSADRGYRKPYYIPENV